MTSGAVCSATNELSNPTSYTYDAQNNVLTVSDALGNTTTNTYDAKGILKTVIDANRKTIGAAETIVGGCGPAGTGDGDNDDADGVIDDGCPSVIYNYDNADRLIEVIDAEGNRTSYGYDGSGNRTSITNPKRQTVGLAESGAQCNLPGLSNGTGNDVDEDLDQTKDDGCPSEKHAYDALNRLQSSTDALGRVTSYQYDAASNLTQRTDARPGLVTEYLPDNMNRVDLIRHWNGTTLVDEVDYFYTAVGAREKMVDSSGTTHYAYDALNRLTCHGPSTIAGPCPSGNVGYSYDDLPGGVTADYPGQRTKITYPDNKTVSYTYDKDGSMKTVTDWLSKQTVYSYDDVGRLTKTQLPNAVFTHHKYDAADRLTCVVNDRTSSPQPSCTSGTTISKFEYPLIDAVGNRKQMVDLAATHTYDYDALYRLKQTGYPGGPTDAYTYDANGNRQTKNTTTYQYDAADQMTWDGSYAYTYDNNGNQTGRGSDTFTYDHENRLTKIVVPTTPTPEEPCYDLNGNGDVDLISDIADIAGQFGGTFDAFYDLNSDLSVDIIGDITKVANQFGNSCPSRFTYSGDGLRTRRSVSQAGAEPAWRNHTSYVWDVASSLPVVLKETDRHNELHNTHGTNNTYVYGLDLISVTDRTGAQTYFLYDGLGSTANLTDGSGTTTGTYSYDVFGAMRSESGSGAFGSEWRFTGEQRDRQGNRNFYYLRARYYDPATGRFLSQDPLPTGNLYAYVGNNPVNFADPSGLCVSAEQGAVLAGATTATAGQSVGTSVIVAGGAAATICVCNATGACAQLADATAEALVDALSAVGGGLGDLAGKVSGLFQSESRGDKIEKWRSKVNAAAGIAARINEDPCAARNHRNRNLRGFLREANKLAKEIKGFEQLRFDLPECEEHRRLLPLPWGSHTPSKE